VGRRGFSKKLQIPVKKPLLATLLSAVLALSVLAAGAKAPPLEAVVYEGAGGRMPLTEWVLRKDPNNGGLAQGFSAGTFSGKPVSLPNVVNPTPYSGKGGATNYRGSVAWYRTSFQASSAGLYSLDFQSANFLASVFLDGHEIGQHRGSYLPFSFVRRLAAGSHTVVVRVDWRNPARQSREGFHRTWFNWGGLDGEVDVRALGESDLSQPSITTTLTPDSEEATSAAVKIGVRVHNYGAARTITPEGSLIHEGATIPIAFPPVAMAAGASTTVTATVTVPHPALWSPGHPNLYALSLAGGDGSTYSARVGLRQLTWHGGSMYLNGQRLLLHGVTIQEDSLGHGDALSPADEEGIVSELEQVGADAVRAQHPLDPALLERLDAAGFLVWQGIGPVEGAGNWYSTTPALLADAEAQARTAVLAAQLHPSIFAWNLVDEVANNGRDQAEVSYVRNTARWLHREDPGTLVAVDVWGDHPPKHPGALYSEADAVAETDYSGWYDSPHDTPAQLTALMDKRLAAMTKAFPGKVLVISEFGAESNARNPEGAPGSYAYQSKILALHIAAYEKDPRLSAMMIWLLRDYPLSPTFSGGSIHHVIHHLKLIEGINGKGLFSYAGKAKPAVEVISRLFKALPSG
jgi:beta-galactosidase/beta-glucuronidase